MARSVFSTIVLVSLCLGRLATAQSRPSFEAASVKSNVANDSGEASRITRTPGGLTATDADFQWLVELAFQTRQIDFSRVPESLRTQRFDITARAAGKIGGDQHWEMLQALLEDRFKLMFHRETKEAQVFALTLGKNSGKNGLGPKLTRSLDPDCPINPSDSNFCGVTPRPGMMIGQRVSIARIARELSPFAGRPVQDETGLTGSFDFQLTWTPDPGASKLDSEKLEAGGVVIDPSGRSFFSAIQSELGLKLESKKGRVETLVIDHVERRSEN